MKTYVKTVIYQIKSKNPEIIDCYIGHTTNLKSRKAEHKYACNNQNSKSFHMKVYTFIRDNGGWDNWEIVEIELYPCNSKREAEIREHYWYFTLGAKLNEISPILDLEKKQNTAEKKRLEKLEITKKKIELQKEERKKYLEEHQEEIKEHRRQVKKEYVKKNRELINEKMRDYNKKTAERRKELARKYYEERKEQGYYKK